MANRILAQHYGAIAAVLAMDSLRVADEPIPMRVEPAQTEPARSVQRSAPHPMTRERARRLRQTAAGQLTASNGVAG